MGMETFKEKSTIKKLLSELIDKSKSFLLASIKNLTIWGTLVLKNLKVSDVFRIKPWNILLISIKNLIIWGNFTCFLRYTSL